MRRKGYVLGLVLSLAAILLGPSPVEAKGIVLINYGDTVSHVADVPVHHKAELRQMLKGVGADPAVGFNYSYFGIFWLDLWTWGGKHSAFGQPSQVKGFGA